MGFRIPDFYSACDFFAVVSISSFVHIQSIQKDITGSILSIVSIESIVSTQCDLFAVLSTASTVYIW